MKIKILTDIPGISKNKIFTPDKEGKIHVYGHTYKVEMLLDSGWAEEIKDDIDIEAIRMEISNDLFTPIENCNDLANEITLSKKDYDWYFSYCIVKAVIDQLNGDWNPDWEQSISERKYVPNFDFRNKKWSIASTGYHIESIFPPCKKREDCQKVIELCEPELKVLFGVK